MTISELYEQIDSLKAQLDELRPLKPQDEERLWKKVRLDWNYNSNHIEGNTLTYGHTKLLLLFDQVETGYTLRENEEMKAHDVAIKKVVELANDSERPLTEAFIRDLNKLILVRPFWKEAITLGGEATRREIIPGEYKRHPNSVQLENGEIFHYDTPEETPSKMADLMDFYRIHSASHETHSLWLASMVHYKFVRIHPFDDGNGRLSRLIMNYILLNRGLPPVIIKDSDKKNYLAALNRADNGDLESFVRYIGENLIASLKLSIDAANGKDIEESEDLDKEIMITKANLKNKSPKFEVRINSNSVDSLINNLVVPATKFLFQKLEKFDDEYVSVHYLGNVNFGGSSNSIAETNDLDKFLMDAITIVKSKFTNETGNFNFWFNKHFKGFKRGNANHQMVTLEFKFQEFYLEFGEQNGKSLMKIPYNKEFDLREVENIMKTMVRTFMAEIEDLAKKSD